MSALAFRAAFAAYALLTCVYALLAYDPFTYTQVIKFDLLPGLLAFGRLHRWLWWPAQAAALASIWPLRKTAGERGYALFALLGGLALLWRPLLPTLESTWPALAWSLAALVPLVWLAALDAQRGLAGLPQQTPDAARPLFRSALLAGGLVYLSFGGLALARGEPVSALLAYSLALHLLVAVAIGAALLLASAFSSARVQLAAGALLIAAALAFGVRRVLANLAFPPATAPLLSGALAVALAAALAGLSLRLAPRENEGAVQRLLRPLALPASWPAFLRLGAPLAACVATALFAVNYDWNFLLQQGAAFAEWLLLLAALATADEEPKASPNAFWLLAAAVLSLAIAVSARTLAQAKGVSTGLADAAARDASLRALAPVQAGRAARDTAFFELLAAHTNLPAARDIKPLDVQLAGAPLAATPARKPDVYLFVMDSLRRDYLPPFSEAAAQFAPNVATFAKDAVAFKNAWSRYGATGLSEPSIWVGGMTPHKQYVTPFGPMNALHKLTAAEGYREHVSVDAILDVVLPQSPDLVRLDAAVANKDYTFCRTLAELKDKLAAEPRDKPAFAYTQPQDIHVSRIAREGDRVPEGAHFPPGVYAPVAARIQKWDACFGDFVRWLDESGRGDESVVILTADHGDSLGEEGRFGHAYTIFPEVLRIPLLVRFPKEWRARVRCKPDDLAFSADLTPTLYALLGHPVQERPPFGAPLCALDQDPPPRHAGPQLVVSSYGPVYGLVSDNGGRLFIADGVNFAEDGFTIGPDWKAERRALSPDERAAGERTIVDQLRRLEAAYGMRWE